MTSLITPSQIDESYPIANHNNNSQGLRDNFAAIKTNLTVAASEITELQNRQQVNSDWNATTGAAAILNKPNVPTSLVNLGIADGSPGQFLTATGNGNFSFTTFRQQPQINSDWAAITGTAAILNKPVIPRSVFDLGVSDSEAGMVLTTDGNGNLSFTAINFPQPIPQVNSDWNATSGAAAILNKPAIPTSVSDLGIPNGTVGQVLTHNGINWSTGIDINLEDHVANRVNLVNYKEKLNSSFTLLNGVLSMDLASGNTCMVPLTDNVTNIVLANSSGWAPNTLHAITLIITQPANGTVKTITWPTNFYWDSKSPVSVTPTLGAIDVFNLITYNGGTTWLCFTASQNMGYPA